MLELNLMKEPLIESYISQITREFKSGQAREHAYRPALKYLFESIVPHLQAINDPKRSEHGAPDFALMKSKELSAGYAEAKDVTEKLDETEESEQMKRYLEYGSLILTNSLEFRFYRHGNKYGEPIIIAKIINGEIVPNENSYKELEDTIKTFLTKTEAITSSAKLAKIMGDKARRIYNKVNEYVANSHERNEELHLMYESFKKILIPDLSEEQFADMYAQTLVYGLFAARYEDKTLGDFDRKEAAHLIPRSNPFLRHFFDHIAGLNFDIRLAIIVNELCEVFKNTNVHELMNAYVLQMGLYGDDKESADPVIHFYEDFLKEYDSEKRKELGAFYTPLPIVRFIIRAVDYLLEEKFNLVNGLSDTSKIEIQSIKQNKKGKELVHKVQILDPATGTGTFLNETVKSILARFKGQEGRVKSYIEEELLPRLHGFELMMAPYTIAHLKLSMTLHDNGLTNYNNRLGIYLTNSLEEGLKIDDTLFGLGFGQSITDESKAASKIKNETPIMVVIGNPPYSISSSNKSAWILNLIKVYKENLDEKKLNLDDDYIKFLRLSEYFIEKAESGIVAMITNNSFIDGITHRQMRKHLLETFDEVYILDLHGNSKKNEKPPTGMVDKNVFEIQQGVAISIFVKKKSKSKKLGTVYHSEIWGKREEKFKALNTSNLLSINWNKVNYTEPYYFFTPKDFGNKEDYEAGFKIDEVFLESVSGVESVRDELTIHFNKQELEAVIKDFIELDEKEISLKYKTNDARDWKISRAKKDIISHIDDLSNYRLISYRPFDIRDIFYTGKQNGFVCNSRFNVMKHMLKENTALVVKRGFDNDLSQPGFITDKIFDRRGWSAPGMQGAENIFPIYLYTDTGTRVSNFKKDFIEKINKIVGVVSEEDILDYIYAILYSSNYKEKYKEFIKIEFPRIPYPNDEKTFYELVCLGKELREIHLMKSKVLNSPTTTFPESGTDVVDSKFVKFKDEKVFINKTQFFGSVPELAWNFYIGGYQPAQKWLKSRKGRRLNNQDIEHYQKIITVLIETDKIMKRINDLVR
jgi:predicted helicase